MHIKAVRNRNRVLIAGTAILLIAGWLRLGAFQEALVGSDQASILAAAADIAAFRRFPGVGIKSSIGVMQTAVTPYLAALPLLIIPKVIAVKWFFSVLDWLAVAFLYRVVKTRWGWHAAWVAASLYAANPWVVEFVRWIWYQSLISTFAAFAFCFFLLLLPGQRRSHPNLLLAAGLVSATLMGMVHLAAVPWTFFLFGVGLILARSGKLWRGFLAGTAASFLVAAPYLIYQVQTRFADAALLGQNSEGCSMNWNIATFRLSAELLSGRSVLTTPRDPLWAEAVYAPDLFYSLVPVLFLGALGGCIFLLLHALSKRKSVPWTVVFTTAWSLLAPALFVLTPFHLQHFYLLFVFPAPYVCIGIALQALIPGSAHETRRWHALRRLGVVSLAGIILLVVVWWAYLWSVRIGYEQKGLLRAPTRAWLMDKVVAETSAYLERVPDGNVIIITPYEGDLSPFDWVRNFVQSGRQPDTRIRVVKPDAGFIMPAAPVCYLMGPGADAGQLDAYAYAATIVPAMTIDANPPWKFMCQGERAVEMKPVAVWQNGLSLLAAGVQGTLTEGADLGLTYTWHYQALGSPPAEVHSFNHLMQGSEMVAQVDGAGIPPWQWRDDDILVTRFTLSMPEVLFSGEYTLITGLYTWPGLERVPMGDGAISYPVQSWTYVCSICPVKVH